ncbi:MAG: PLP-dependent aminotransferase family protein [Ilumatobacteraceae bacterium]
MELLLTLPPHGSRQTAVEQALRAAIVDGRLAPGAVLPSTRALAADLGLARGTVVAAVEQLAVEGLVETRQGAPTRVAHVPPALRRTLRPTSARPVEARRALADFGGGDPDLTLFPRAWWASAVRRGLSEAAADALGYGDPQGSPVLRSALVDHLSRTRGVIADPDQVVTTAGFTHALVVLARALRATGARRIAVEDPSLAQHRDLLAATGLDVAPVVVDADGVEVDELPERSGTVALVTPAHHTPLGVTLSAPRRSELAGWAARVGGIIVEDDYDGELRYDRRPLPALQALDPNRVIYAGTASKSLVPGLRLGWCVLPPDLVGPTITAMVSLGGQPVSIVEQLALADLLRSGRYDRHVRTLLTAYRRRRDLLVATLAERVPAVRVEGVAAGLKALIRLPRGVDEATVVAALEERDIALMSLRSFCASARTAAGGPALVVNFSRPFGHEYRAAVAHLADALAAILAPDSP